MKAVLMAGGKGTRLRPITKTRPKPMVPVVNRPVMEHVIALLKSQGIREIIATLRYLPSAIQDYFGDGSRFGVDIEYSLETEPLGTAGSVKMVEKSLDDTFLVMSGDLLTDVDIRRAIQSHENGDAIVTIILTKVPNPLEYGIVDLDENRRITRFLEKPGWGEVFSHVVNAGIYVIEPEALKYVKRGIPFDFSLDLFPLLLKKKLPLYGHIASGYWTDIGNVNQYLKANHDVLSGEVAVRIPEILGRQDRGSIWIEGGFERDSDIIIMPPTFIGKNCRVSRGSQIGPFTILGNEVKLGERSHIEQSVMMDGVSIGPNSKLSGCVVGKGCGLKNGTTISEGVIIADNCVVGEKTVVEPYVKIWPEKKIAPGIMLASDQK